MKGSKHSSDPIPDLSATIGDFWAWAYSNLNENTVRPVFAEFLVGSLLGIQSTGRTEWDAYDLLYEATKVEVKSSAYVQAWRSPTPSPPRFDIAPKSTWDVGSRTFKGPIKRQADVYVFCFYPERERDNANPMDIAAWQFWVVPSQALDRELGVQKSLGLTTLARFTESVGADQLRQTVDCVVGSL